MCLSPTDPSARTRAGLGPGIHALPVDTALAIMEEELGTALDPDCLDALIAAIPQFELN